MTCNALNLTPLSTPFCLFPYDWNFFLYPHEVICDIAKAFTAPFFTLRSYLFHFDSLRHTFTFPPVTLSYSFPPRYDINDMTTWLSLFFLDAVSLLLTWSMDLTFHDIRYMAWHRKVHNLHGSLSQTTYTRSIISSSHDTYILDCNLISIHTLTSFPCNDYHIYRYFDTPPYISTQSCNLINPQYYASASILHLIFLCIYFLIRLFLYIILYPPQT